MPKHTIPADWLIPAWPAPANVHALCTTRHGGYSLGAFGSANMALHVGDDGATVFQNRALLAHAMQVLEAKKDMNFTAAPPQPIFLHQVHAADVRVIDSCTTNGQTGDASVTATAGVGCAILVADCLPVLLSHASLPVVGAAHAGWRGLAGQGGPGVLQACFNAYAQRVREQVGGAVHTAEIAAQTIAWLGPCISQPAFEVGAEVRQAFVAHDAGTAALFSVGKPGKYHADLAGLARRILAAQGIVRLYGNDSSPPWCTAGNPERFFSHRRDGTPGQLGGTGRLAACVWIGATAN